ALYRPSLERCTRASQAAGIRISAAALRAAMSFGRDPGLWFVNETRPPRRQPLCPQGETMSVRAATPYLKFFGRAAEAIEHYQQAFGATVKVAQRFGEVMNQCPAALADRIMHAELDLGSAIIMLSDG